MAIELPTYSAVFAFEKRLYAIYDFELPVSVSLFQGGAYLAALGVTIAVHSLIGTPLDAFWFFAWVVPPGAVAWRASRPLADGKRPHEWVATRLRHLGEPRTLARLHPERTPSRWRPHAAVVIPTAAAACSNGATEQYSSGAVAQCSSGASKEKVST